MARYRGPKAKIARRFKEPIFGPSKALEKKIMDLDNTAIAEEEVNNQNMLYSWLKSKKLNIRMVY